MAKKRARRRNYFRRGKSYRKRFTLPLAVVGGFIPILSTSYVGFKQGGLGMAGRQFVTTLTGFDPENSAAGWQPKEMRRGALPILVGYVAHMIASKLGINRALGRAGIPFVRI